MRKWWIGLLVLATGCSSGATAAKDGRRVLVTTTTTTTTVPVPATQERPVDDLGMRCQAAVDAALAALKASGQAPVDADGVCRTREQDSLLGDRTGYSIGVRFVVRYPFDRFPESRWDQTWHDVAVHEIGHTWSRRLDAAHRQVYAAIRGQSVWSDEDYADVYAAVIGGAEWLGYIGTPPPADQVDRLCAEDLLPC